MNKISISGVELTIENGAEILRMGGPWIGDILIGQELISKDCIIDNFSLKEDKHVLFFVKYHPISKYYWYFTINFYNIQTKNIFEFKREFDIVHLGEFISQNELRIFHAFHDQTNNSSIFNLDQEEFYQV